MLRLTNLRKSYGARVAVDGVSLEVKRGEVFGLLGPNGAGKSTIIGMAVGLLRADSGSVEIDGSSTRGPVSPADPRTRTLFGVAPQSLAIYDDLSAEENLSFFGKLYGLSGARLRERVDYVLHAVGLADRRCGRASTFSGGMKRRLNLGVAMVHDPALLLLDEPTVGVDPQSRNAIFDILEGLRREGRTILYTTHYMEEAQRLCDRVGIIDHGKMLALGTVDSLIGAHGGKSIITVDRDEGDLRIETVDPLAELRPILTSGSARGIRIDRPNLETVFLTLTGRSLRD